MNFKDKIKNCRDIYKNVTTEIIKSDLWKGQEKSWEFIDQGMSLTRNHIFDRFWWQKWWFLGVGDKLSTDTYDSFALSNILGRIHDNYSHLRNRVDRITKVRLN